MTTTAADVMTEKPISINVKRTVGEAARLLDELAVRHLPVVNDQRELVGMLSDRDLRGVSVSSRAGDLIPDSPPPTAPLVDVMSADVVQVGADAPIAEIAEHMVENRVGAIPVVDTEGRLLGIVSYIDILRSLADGELETE